MVSAVTESRLTALSGLFSLFRIRTLVQMSIIHAASLEPGESADYWTLFEWFLRRFSLKQLGKRKKVGDLKIRSGLGWGGSSKATCLASPVDPDGSNAELAGRSYVMIK